MFGYKETAAMALVALATQVSAQADSESNNTTSSGPVVARRTSQTNKIMLIAHGVVASLAFVILFPAGAIALRLSSFPGIVRLHAAFQIISYIVYIVGAGLGAYVAQEMDLLNDYHPILGIAVLLVMFAMPFFGHMHHKLFVKYKHRTSWSYAHIWVGRAAITFGIVNGGLGLNVAYNLHLVSRPPLWAYIAISVIMWLLWVAAMFIGEQRKRANAVEAPVKLESQRRH